MRRALLARSRRPPKVIVRELTRLALAGVPLGRRVTLPSTVREVSRIRSAVSVAPVSTVVEPGESRTASEATAPPSKYFAPAPVKLDEPVTFPKNTAAELVEIRNSAPGARVRLL